MIKHYKAIEGRTSLIIRVEDISSINHYTEKNYNDVFWVEMIVGGCKVKYDLTPEELDELIEDMKAADNPKHEITNTIMDIDEQMENLCYAPFKENEHHNPDTVKFHHWSEALLCYVDINGKPVL